MSRTRIFLADDHAILLDALKKLLEPLYHVVGAVTDGRALVEQAAVLRPDVFVIDIAMPRLNGLDACRQIKALIREARIIFLTMNEDADTAAEAVRCGASGYLIKKSAGSELFKALQTVLLGRVYVSPCLSAGLTSLFVAEAKANDSVRELSLRQREVLQLIAEGSSMKEAADSLSVTPRTIAFHKYSMMERLGIKTSAELVQHAVQLGLVTTKPVSQASSTRRPAHATSQPSCHF